jgi:diacylglycerol kinase
MRQSLLKKFCYAICGLKSAFLFERSIRIHLCCAMLVVIVGVIWQVKPIEWALLFFAIGLVLVAELLNTAIENTVDLLQEQYHPLAKTAKDVAAGAVLVAALTALIIGILVLGPYFFGR